MNIQEYIESGVLELYVAGMLPEDEAMEVTSLLKEYPELKAEVEAIEESLGMYASSFTAPKPGPSVLEHALAEIEADEDNSNSGQSGATPFEPIPKSSSFPRYMLWAAIIMFLFSLVGNIYQYQLGQSTQSRVQELIQANQELQQNLNQSESVLALYEDPDFNRIILEGQEISPNSSALVYWNPNTSQVYLQASRLPQPPVGSQYQLWAIQGGQPVDAGVFDINERPQSLKEISGSTDAFAITLEPQGGSEAPTLDLLYVIGNVSG